MRTRCLVRGGLRLIPALHRPAAGERRTHLVDEIRGYGGVRIDHHDRIRSMVSDGCRKARSEGMALAAAGRVIQHQHLRPARGRPPGCFIRAVVRDDQDRCGPFRRAREALHASPDGGLLVVARNHDRQMLHWRQRDVSFATPRGRKAGGRGQEEQLAEQWKSHQDQYGPGQSDEKDEPWHASNSLSHQANTRSN